MSERRHYSRGPVMRQANLLTASGAQISCTIGNLSREGAMLVLEEKIDLPNRFVLDMSGNIVVRRLCDLVWHDGHSAGVTFARRSNIEFLP